MDDPLIISFGRLALKALTAFQLSFFSHISKENKAAGSFLDTQKACLFRTWVVERVNSQEPRPRHVAPLGTPASGSTQ